MPVGPGRGGGGRGGCSAVDVAAEATAAEGALHESAPPRPSSQRCTSGEVRGLKGGCGAGRRGRQLPGQRDGPCGPGEDLWGHLRTVGKARGARGTVGKARQGKARQGKGCKRHNNISPKLYSVSGFTLNPKPYSL